MLNDRIIRKLIEEKNLISNYIDLEKQLQPSGFDLSLESMEEFLGAGAVDFSNEERVIADTIPLEVNEDEWYTLGPGCYKVVYNEIVKMPLDLAAIARTRSTLLRNGVTVGTAVWDPGYEGRSSSLLTVHNSKGTEIKRNARIAQLVFYPTGLVNQGYEGVYQLERIP
jgi:dUTP pyrophosphatase